MFDMEEMTINTEHCLSKLLGEGTLQQGTSVDMSRERKNKIIYFNGHCNKYGKIILDFDCNKLSVKCVI